MTDVFRGTIAGIGTTSGIRIVVGDWTGSPFGAFADVMIENAAGRRQLLAPDESIAAYVAATYTFDEVRIGAIAVTRGSTHTVRAGALILEFDVGARTAMGRLLRAVPPPLGAHPAWCRAIDPLARRLRPGVRTAGSAGGGRREYYGAHDEHAIIAARGGFAGTDLGALAPVLPPVRFGFGSAPARPALVRVTTSVTRPDGS